MVFKKYLPENFIYRPLKDESIEQIATKFNADVNDVEYLSVGEHYEGEFVKIKSGKEHTHIVKPLEDLNSIAQKYNVSAYHIEQCNNLKTRRLFIGQKLRF